MASRPRQISLPGFVPRLTHGGGIAHGRRKTMRPMDPRRPIHITLRAEIARGPLSMLQGKHARRIRAKVEQLAARHKVRIFRFANVGNHLHLLVQAKSRRAFQSFLRVAAGQVAQIVTQARKGNPFGKFWDTLAFTRVIEWGRDLRSAWYYVLKNQLEAEGSIDHSRPSKAADHSRPSRSSDDD